MVIVQDLFRTRPSLLRRSSLPGRFALLCLSPVRLGLQVIFSPLQTPYSHLHRFDAAQIDCYFHHDFIPRLQSALVRDCHEHSRVGAQFPQLLCSP